ncbi:metallophosphoesterase [Breznakiellaceae bacterium SP9]
MAKKRIAIGDVHGRGFWKNHLDADFDEYYILGDYFDSYFLSFRQQKDNFIEICDAARKDGRIKLCLGNHDFHYMSCAYSEHYSGFQDEHYEEINEVLEENMDLIKIVYATEDNFLLSHAGVSLTFLRYNSLASVEEINPAFTQNPRLLIFNGTDIYGDNRSQGPLWIRPRSLLADAVPRYKQIVGHTPRNTIDERVLTDGRKIVFINTEMSDSVYTF